MRTVLGLAGFSVALAVALMLSGWLAFGIREEVWWASTRRLQAAARAGRTREKGSFFTGATRILTDVALAALAGWPILLGLGAALLIAVLLMPGGVILLAGLATGAALAALSVRALIWLVLERPSARAARAWAARQDG